MDNQQIINFQDFYEVPAEQEYIALGLSSNNKKQKNYEKALEKFKSSITKGFIYINSNLEQFNLNGFRNNVLIDESNHIIEVLDEPILGTQLILNKDKAQIFVDRQRHLININPLVYKLEDKNMEIKENGKNHFQQIDQLIKEEKQKNKKSVVKKQ